MRKHPDFSGFDEIVADDLLRERIRRAADRQLLVRDTAGSRAPRRRGGAAAAAAACVLAVAVGVAVWRLPGGETAPMPDTDTPADTGTPPSAITGDMFRVMAYSPATGGAPLEISVDGVDLVLPGVGFDYRPETVGGAEVETLSGVVSPDISVQGDDIESVTYRVEIGDLQYEDSRAWVTEDGLRTWLSEYYRVDAAAFADPAAPTGEELLRALRALQDSGETLPFEQQLWAIEKATQFYDANGRHPTWEQDLDFHNSMYDDFVSRPLDFSQYEISAEYDEEDRSVWVTLRNPDNPLDRAMHHGKTIADVRPGEPVTYLYANDVWEQYRVKGARDLRELRDTMTIDIRFKNGETKTVHLDLRHDEDGVLTVRGSDTL